MKPNIISKAGVIPFGPD